MEFDSEITNLLLKGGTIIVHHSHKKTGLEYFTIRMPKDEFVTCDGRDFEYLECSNAPRHDRNVASIGTYRNGHVREVKRKCYDNYTEDRIYEQKQLERNANKPEEKPNPITSYSVIRVRIPSKEANKIKSYFEKIFFETDSTNKAFIQLYNKQIREQQGKYISDTTFTLDYGSSVDYPLNHLRSMPNPVKAVKNLICALEAYE